MVDIIDDISGDLPVPATVTFNDTDGNNNQIGGKVTWTPPADESKITHYAVHFVKADNSIGNQIGLDIAQGSTYEVTIPVDTNVTSDTDKIRVYSKKDAVYSATGREIAVVDSGTLDATVAQTISFTDTDAQLNEISGQVTWTGASDESHITGYGLYFVNVDDTQGAQIESDVAKSSPYSITIPANTTIPTGVYRIAIYAKDGSQSSVSSKVIEAVQLAISPAFIDTDNGANKIGGTITFTQQAMKLISHTMKHISLMILM